MEKIPYFTKSERPIDYLPDRPLNTLQGLWKEENIRQLIHGELTFWFYMALSNDCAAPYVDDDGEGRATFIEFYSDLLPVIEASYCQAMLYSADKKSGASSDVKKLTALINEHMDDDYSFIYISEKEMLDPRQVMINFCLRYPIDYARRELWDFFEAASSYGGRFRKQVSVYHFSETYMKLLTIVESAYAIAVHLSTED
jgi:hypothetical protein